MQIRFAASGLDHDRDLASLYTWLRDDRALRGRVKLDVLDRTAPGEMGGAFDAVVAVVSAGAALVSAGAAVGQMRASMKELETSIREWREARRPRSIIVVISDGDPKDIQQIIAALSDPDPADLDAADPEPEA